MDTSIPKSPFYIGYTRALKLQRPGGDMKATRRQHIAMARYWDRRMGGLEEKRDAHYCEVKRNTVDAL